MSKNIPTLGLTFAIAVLACSFAGTAFAQDSNATSVKNAKPMYAVMPARLRTDLAAPPAASFSTWNGSFTFSGTTYNYNMVGSAPSSNTSTTVSAIIIPVKIVITNRNGSKTTYDPAHVLSKGNTVITNIVQSPIFDATTSIHCRTRRHQLV